MTSDVATVVQNTGEVATFSDGATVTRQRIYSDPLFQGAYTENGGIVSQALFLKAFAIGYTVQQVKDVLNPPVTKPEMKSEPEDRTCHAVKFKRDGVPVLCFEIPGNVYEFTPCPETGVSFMHLRGRKHWACEKHRQNLWDQVMAEDKKKTKRRK